MSAASDERVALEHDALWSIDPIDFDPRLVDLAREAIGDESRRDPLTSGPLHDAAALAQAGVPVVMLFVRSLGGISHSPAEDSDEQDLRAAVTTLAELAVTAASRRLAV